jgi:signal transduction histidine kinase
MRLQRGTEGPPATLSVTLAVGGRSLNLLDLTLDALFLAVFGVAAIRFIRTPDPLQRDVLAVFAMFAAISVLQLVLPWSGPLRPLLGFVFLGAILGQGPLTVRLARQFRHQPRWLLPLVWAAAAVAFVVAVSGLTRSPAGFTLVIAVVVLTDLAAAVLLARAAGTRIGVARVRLAISAGSTAAFGGAILAVGLAAAFPAPSGSIGPLELIARVLALGAAVGYLIAFLPPARLLQSVQRAVAFSWLDRIVRVSGQADDAPVDAGPGTADRPPAVPGLDAATLVALADAAREISGARSAAVTFEDSVVAVSGDPVEPRRIGELLAGAAAAELGPTRVIRLPAGDGPVLGLVLRFEGTPLFVDDDVALIGLLAQEARRAAGRDRAAHERLALQQQLAMERHRADAEARFRDVLDAQPTALLAVGPRGRVLYANTRAVETLGTTHERILGDDVRRWLPDDPVLADRFVVGEAIAPTALMVAGGETGAAVVVTDGAAHETVARRPDGACFPVEVGIAGLPGDEGEVTLVTLTDISERKAAEVLRDRFIDLLSHELRTPVTALYGFATLLASGRGLAPEVEQEVLADMVLESDRLQRMVENLIALARAERGVPMGGDDPVLLQRLVPRIVAGEQRLWPAATFVTDLPPHLATVRGDDDYLGQVLRNLLSNAAKYGGDAGPIEIGAEQLDGRVRLWVADRGRGFAASEAESLFELYYRSAGVARDTPGAGIGLFVCRRIVDAMGGRIRARPRDGGGAVLELELPVYESDEVIEPQPYEVAAGR